MTTEPDRPKETANTFETNAEDRKSKSTGANPPPNDTHPILEEVVKRTLAEHEQFAASHREALLEVARRFPQATLDVDPVGTALVGAVLRAQFPTSTVGESLEVVARVIAETLLFDPPSRLRLKTLWSQLLQSVEK